MIFFYPECIIKKIFFDTCYQMHFRQDKAVLHAEGLSRATIEWFPKQSDLIRINDDIKI